MSVSLWLKVPLKHNEFFPWEAKKTCISTILTQLEARIKEGKMCWS